MPSSLQTGLGTEGNTQDRPPGEGEHILSHTAVCIPGHRWLFCKHLASACFYGCLPRGCSPGAQTASPVSCPGMAQALPTGPAACHTQSTCCQAQCSCRPALVVSGLTWQTEPAAQLSRATQLGTHIFQAGVWVSLSTWSFWQLKSIHTMSVYDSISIYT